MPKIDADLERTRIGVNLRLSALGCSITCEFTPEEWATLVTEGSRLVGLPDPWKAA